MTGKERRLRRLFSVEHQRCLMVPLDHGPWLGPVEGIRRSQDIVRSVIAGGANALLVTPGFWRAVANEVPPETGIVLRVSITGGLSPQASQETPIATVESALRLGADAVAASIFFGRAGDLEALRYVGELVDSAARYDLVVLAEVMPPESNPYDAGLIAHAARIASELGADVVKTNYTGHPDSFRRVLEGVSIPVIVAGGPAVGGDEATIAMAAEAVRAGAAGVAFGRRVWQSTDAQGLVRRLCAALATV
jgi:DhnA family fructose-bisphosphate aldolase class Ia